MGWPGAGPGMFPPAEAQNPDMSSEQAMAIHEAVAATQQAQYMQQVQFLQQVRAANNQVENKKENRFKDDYKPFRMCRQFSMGECLQGHRCIYAHCFEELHPASPDLPKNEQGSVDALSEMKP